MHQFDEIINRRNTNSKKWDAYKDNDIIVMASADMDFKSATCIRDALVKKAEEAMYGYEGKSDGYYESIINWNKRIYDYDIEQSWLTNVPGVNLGVRLCIDTFTNPGDTILMHSPYFSPFLTEIDKSKRKLVTSSLKLINDQYEMDFLDFENKIIENKVKMFIFVSPHNPTGKVFTKEELQKIGEICDKHDVIVLSDEVHCNVLFDDHVHYPYTAVNDVNANHGIIITSITKGFNVQGLTYGILIIPNPVYRQMFEETVMGYNLDYATNIFSMASVVAAYNEGKEWLDQLNEYLLGNLNYLTEFIENKIPSIKVIRPQASYLVWLDMRQLGLTPDEMKKIFLEEAKVAFSFGEEFGIDGEGFQRLNFACPRRVLKEALERIGKIINNL